MQAIIVTTLEDDKAEDIIALDLAGRAAFADRMVIATGLADRQISAMATHLHEKLIEAGFKKPLEGATGTDWVLLDAGDIIVHLFKPEARTLYGLEKMWSAELDEADPEIEAARHRQGRPRPGAELFARYAERIKPALTLVEFPDGLGSPAEIKRREAETLLAALKRENSSRAGPDGAAPDCPGWPGCWPDGWSRAKNWPS